MSYTYLEPTVLVALASFALGCVTPIIYGRVAFIIRKWRGFPTLIAFLASYGLSSVGLVYLSTIASGEARVIVIAFMIGVGVVRWLRHEL
jgi:hypothetical protein